MMTLELTLAPDFTAEALCFDGLTGMERVANVKEALNVLRVQNPAIAFIQAVKDGEYNDMSDEDYKQTLESFKSITGLFHHPDKPGDASHERELNLIELLHNALIKILEQDVALRRLREGRQTE